MFDVSVVLRVVCDWCEWLAFEVGLGFAFFDCCLRLSVFAAGYVGFACGGLSVSVAGCLAGWSVAVAVCLVAC